MCCLSADCWPSDTGFHKQYVSRSSYYLIPCAKILSSSSSSSDSSFTCRKALNGVASPHIAFSFSRTVARAVSCFRRLATCWQASWYCCCLLTMSPFMVWASRRVCSRVARTLLNRWQWKYTRKEVFLTTSLHTCVCHLPVNLLNLKHGLHEYPTECMH